MTQHQGKTKVQLSALEKSILAPIYPVAEEQKVVIDAISPLSWTLKSVISLEPSLSAVELGKHLYIAQHYIGVEQSTFFPTEEISNVIETVRTLKGAEPNLQTLYLITSPETGTAIKEKLKQRIPLQQLTEDEETTEGLPTYLKVAIETAAKTFDIEDYPVPRFALEEYGSKKSAQKSQVTKENLSDEEKSLVAAPALPSTKTPLSATPATTLKTTVETMDSDDEDRMSREQTISEKMIPGEIMPELEMSEHELEETQFVDRDSDQMSDTVREPFSPTTALSESTDWLDDNDDDDDEDEQEMLAENIRPFQTVTPSMKPTQTTMPSIRQRQIIKNRNSTGSLVRMIGISIAALVITVVVGVGAGLALLKTSEKNAPINQVLAPSPKVSPIVQASPAATASPSASVAPTIARDKIKILVVNATGVTGKAGTVKTALTQAGYKSVSTGNAKGTYQKGNFLLMAKQNPELLTQLEKDSKLDLTFGTEDKTVEDPKSAYDLVFVVNQ